MPIMDNWIVPMDRFGQRYSDGLLDAQPRTRPNLLRFCQVKFKVDGPERSVMAIYLIVFLTETESSKQKDRPILTEHKSNFPKNFKIFTSFQNR